VESARAGSIRGVGWAGVEKTDDAPCAVFAGLWSPVWAFDA
jgi:hypothetical protein